MEEIDSSRFFRVYDNIPITARKELIVIVENEPMSWKVAHIEIKNKTELGAKALQNLMDLEFI